MAADRASRSRCGPQLAGLAVDDQDRLEDAVSAQQPEVVDLDLGDVGVGRGSVEEDEHAHADTVLT